MGGRSNRKAEPRLERLDEKQLLSAGAAAANVARPASGLRPAAIQPVQQGHQSTNRASRAGSGRLSVLHPIRISGDHAAARSLRPSLLDNKFLAFRITNPKSSVNLVPPFQQVLVQSKQPVPDQVYNVLYVAVKNGTARTFDASSGFTVRLTNQSKSQSFPIITSTEQWKPNQWFVFYVLTKKYYPVSPVAGGFQLDLGGGSSTLIPGPSGIFLRLKYNPETFARTLNWIVAYGQGAQQGNGPPLGLPDTAIDEFVSARTQRNDFGGHF